MITIRTPKTIAEWQAYYNLRYEVLRKPWNQSFESAKTPEDDFAQHFAAFENQKLLAVGRLDLLNETTGQIRFFAVDPNHQGKRIGQQLLSAMEASARSQQIQRIILEARANAVRFYEHNGYQISEKGKILFDIIPHFWMFKELE